MKVKVGRKGVVVSLDDPLSLVGQTVLMPNDKWGARYSDGGATLTAVLHRAPGAGDDGSDAYICEADGHKYLFALSDVAAAAASAAAACENAAPFATAAEGVARQAATAPRTRTARRRLLE